MDAAHYARFLRKNLMGELAIEGRFGEGAVCTLPSSCPAAHESPAPWPWHYSIGHWVEDDAGNDGAFSSAGAFGFYPWIDAAKMHYGIVARHSLHPKAWGDSAACGRVIRRAFATGRAE